MKFSRGTSKPFLLLDNTAHNRSMQTIKIQMSILSFLRAPHTPWVLILITDPSSGLITLRAPSTFPKLYSESPKYFVAGLVVPPPGNCSLTAWILTTKTTKDMTGLFLLHAPSPSPFFFFLATLYLPNFLIWFTASPYAAAAEQLGTVGSNGRRQHYKPALLPMCHDPRNTVSSSAPLHLLRVRAFPAPDGPFQPPKTAVTVALENFLSSFSALSFFFGTSWRRQVLHRLYPNTKDC